MLVLIVAGATWYGFSTEDRVRFWQNVIQRPGGPMKFRFILQPVMATIAALHDGIRDARIGRSPYFWTILTNRTDRAARLHEGLLSTARIVLLGLVMDTVYQVIVFKTFYPIETVIVAILLAFLPYLLLRGPIARVARRWYGDAPVNQG
ncbi:MAG TPA: hypothetical protein VGF36_07205 [Rhodopila sp.]